MHFENKKRRLALGIAAGVVLITAVVVVIVLVTGFNPLPGANFATLAIAAEKDSPVGVEQDSGFIITSPEPLEAASLRQNLRIVPEVAYELEQRGDYEVFLKPGTPLAAETVYNIQISENAYDPPLSWAFQTRNVFRVAATLPADQGYSVPLNSGIEFHFSQPVADIGSAVTISPAVAGSFSQFDDKTVVFIPSEALQASTDYSVTLAAGLAGQTGETLGADYTFTFHTQYSDEGQSRTYIFAPYDGLTETYTSSDPVFIRLSAEGGFANQEVQVDIYRYPSLDAYLDAVESGLADSDTPLPTTALNKVSSFDSQLYMNTDIYWNVAFLEVPENPGLGWYLADIRTPDGDGPLNNQHTQKLLQVSDLALYSQTAHNELLLWLNDAGSGQPVSGAQITVEAQQAVSDADGLALLEIPYPQGVGDDNGYYYGDYMPDKYRRRVKIVSGEQQFGDYLAVASQADLPWSESYYSYVYTDRAAYQPNDTVHFWGLVLPRQSSAAQPTQLQLAWTAGGLYPDGIAVEVQADGSFQGTVTLEKQTSGWTALTFNLDGKYLAEAGFNVLAYVKPVYTAELTLDKEYYRKNDNIQAAFQVNFYDGTPAPGLDITLSLQEQSATVTSDQNGFGQANLQQKAQTSWRPYSNWVYGSSGGAEDQGVYFEKRVRFFPSDYMIETDLSWGRVHTQTPAADGSQADPPTAGADVLESPTADAVDNQEEDATAAPVDSPQEETQTAGQVTRGLLLSLAAYQIDFAHVDDGTYTEYSPDYSALRGPRAEISGSATLYQVRYIKTKTGEYYDMINKVTVERFNYEKSETVLQTFPLQTTDGQLLLPIAASPEEELTYYYVKLSLTTPDGGTLEETCYPPGYSYYYSESLNSQTTRYYLRQGRDDTGLSNNYDYYYSYQTYGLEDTIELHVRDQDGNQPQQGRVLYSVITINGHQSRQVSPDAWLDLEFTPQYLPNAVIAGAYFDGKHIFSLQSAAVEYNTSGSALTLQVTPDQEQYSPGAEVELHLQVRDAAGQEQAANYLLSIADEAVFAIEEQQVDPLTELYTPYYIWYSQYATYIQPYDIETGAESGEGGADSTRREFLDTAAFLSGRTGADGSAVVRFTLPDNLTSWRITGIAYQEQGASGVNVPQAGSSISNLSATLPFFLNQVLNEHYLAGESIGLTLRAAGTAITPADTVQYEVTLSDDSGVVRQQSLSNPANDYATVVFEPLPAGTYKVLLKAQSGSHTDAVEKEISVVDSLLLTARSESGNLAEGMDISPKRFPVGIYLFDQDSRTYYDILYNLLYAYGKRADQALSRALAGQRLNQLDPQYNYATELEVDGDEVAAWRDGLRLFPYAERDPLLTAKALISAGAYLDAAALGDYFSAILLDHESSSTAVAAAYMGLGALKQPVLLDLQSLLAQAEQGTDFTVQEQLYLASGLALLGDLSTARAWYTANISGLLQKDGDYLYIKSSESQGEDYIFSAEAAMLATLLNHPDHLALLRYVLEHSSNAYTPLLETAVYISKYTPKPENAAAFTYQLNGQTQTHTFDQSRMTYLELGEQQLAASNFQVTEGQVGYTVYYTGGQEEAANTLPPGVTLSQKISNSTPSLGETITVETTLTFGADALVGYYNISQIVPSGLRFTGVPGYTGQNAWYYSVGESGMIDYYVYPSRTDENGNPFNAPRMPSSVTFSYTARAVLPGSYIMEAAAINYSGSNTLYAGERASITVSE